MKDSQTEYPDEKHRENPKDRAERRDKKKHLLRTEEASDSREGCHLGLTLVLAKRKKVPVCTVTETVICEVVSIHTSKLSKFGFLKLAHGAGWEPSDCASFLVQSPQCRLCLQVDSPWSTRAVPSVLVKCKYDPL